MLDGFPISTKLPDDLGLGERFWYWRGKSGQTYIHSIYSRENCPPLPGAVYVVVENRSGSRKAVCVGRFARSFDGAAAQIAGLGAADEIHVHLLAQDGAAATVRDDLDAALTAVPEMVRPALGFSEAVQLELLAA